MHTLKHPLSLTLAATVVTATAQAQLVDIEYENGLVKMTSLKDGKVLVDPRGLTQHDGGPLDVIKPSIEVVEFPDGYDTIYTFTNNTGQPMPLGRLKLGIFTIGEEVTYRDFRWGGHELPADANNFGGLSVRYPLSLYSPVHVIQSEDYAIGVSLQYPVLDYKHDFTLSMVSPGGNKAIGPGGRGFALIYKMNHFGGEGDGIAMSYTAWLEPGETQEYTVSVRATDNTDEWIRTLLPYREFFHEQYGGVRYERDPRAILGFMAATSNEIDDHNVEGWTSPNTLRPDQKGWGPWKDWMFERDNWERMMMWMPGGTYMYDRHEPFDFVRNWEGHPLLMQATDPVHGFGEIEDNGRKFGLWWSQSVNFSESWGNLVGFDIENPEHTDAWFAEVDLAVETGATMIGLDTFTHKKLAIWDQYEWLQKAQERHPHVTFVIEPLTMDFMHTLAPAHYTGHDDLNSIPDKLEDLWMFHSPHYLADFINPGHEIWGAWRYWAYQFFGVEFTPEMVKEDMQKIADLGYAPLIFTGMEVDLDKTYDAAETWYDTVPADLLYFAPPKDPGGGGDDNGGGGDGDGGQGDGGQGGENGDHGVGGDFAEFQMLFQAGDMRADCNKDGKLTVLDFVCFQESNEAPVMTFVGGGGDAKAGKAAPTRTHRVIGRAGHVPVGSGGVASFGEDDDRVSMPNSASARSAIRSSRSDRRGGRVSLFGVRGLKAWKAPVVRAERKPDSD